MEKSPQNFSNHCIFAGTHIIFSFKLAIEKSVRDYTYYVKMKILAQQTRDIYT